jgi:hypothetical protein
MRTAGRRLAGKQAGATAGDGKKGERRRHGALL